MPGRPWLKLYLLKDLKEKIKPLRRASYMAAGMLLLAAALMLTVAGGVKYSARQGPSVAQPPPKAALAPPAVVKADPQVEPAAAPIEAPPAKPASPPPAASPEQPGRLPVQGAVKLDFGWQLHPVFNDWRYHTGVDFSAAEGTPVGAAWAGRVAEVYQDRQYGLTVAIRSGQYTVYYGSLSTAAVEKDRQVKAGETIGAVGASASEPYPHLHLAISEGDRFVNPLERIGK